MTEKKIKKSDIFIEPLKAGDAQKKPETIESKPDVLRRESAKETLQRKLKAANQLIESEAGGLREIEPPTVLQAHVTSSDTAALDALDSAGRLSADQARERARALANPLERPTRIIDTKTELAREDREMINEVLNYHSVGMHTALGGDYSRFSGGGFQNKLELLRERSEYIAPIVRMQQFENSIRVEKEKLSAAGISDAVVIEPLTKTKYKPVEKVEKRLLRADKITSEKVMDGTEPVTSEEVFLNISKIEPLYRFAYQTVIYDNYDYKESTHRSNLLNVDIIIPESVAKKLAERIQKNPGLARELVANAVTQNMGIPEQAWQQGNEHTGNHPIRPPYEAWAAKNNGSKMYVVDYTTNPPSEDWQEHGKIKPENIKTIALESSASARPVPLQPADRSRSQRMPVPDAPSEPPVRPDTGGGVMPPPTVLRPLASRPTPGRRPPEPPFRGPDTRNEGLPNPPDNSSIRDLLNEAKTREYYSKHNYFPHDPAKQAEHLEKHLAQAKFANSDVLARHRAESPDKKSVPQLVDSFINYVASHPDLTEQELGDNPDIKALCETVGINGPRMVRIVLEQNQHLLEQAMQLALASDKRGITRKILTASAKSALYLAGGATLSFFTGGAAIGAAAVFGVRSLDMWGTHKKMQGVQKKEAEALRRELSDRSSLQYQNYMQDFFAKIAQAKQEDIDKIDTGSITSKIAEYRDKQYKAEYRAYKMRYSPELGLIDGGDSRFQEERLTPQEKIKAYEMAKHELDSQIHSRSEQYANSVKQLLYQRHFKDDFDRYETLQRNGAGQVEIDTVRRELERKLAESGAEQLVRGSQALFIIDQNRLTLQAESDIDPTVFSKMSKAIRKPFEGWLGSKTVREKLVTSAVFMAAGRAASHNDIARPAFAFIGGWKLGGMLGEATLGNFANKAKREIINRLNLNESDVDIIQRAANPLEAAKHRTNDLRNAVETNAKIDVVNKINIKLTQLLGGLTLVALGEAGHEVVQHYKEHPEELQGVIDKAHAAKEFFASIYNSVFEQTETEPAAPIVTSETPGPEPLPAPDQESPVPEPASPKAPEPKAPTAPEAAKSPEAPVPATPPKTEIAPAPAGTPTPDRAPTGSAPEPTGTSKAPTETSAPSTPLEAPVMPAAAPIEIAGVGKFDQHTWQEVMTVNEEEGVSYPLIRQLEQRASEFGYDKTTDPDKHKWALDKAVEMMSTTKLNVDGREAIPIYDKATGQSVWVMQPDKVTVVLGGTASEPKILFFNTETNQPITSTEDLNAAFDFAPLKTAAAVHEHMQPSTEVHASTGEPLEVNHSVASRTTGETVFPDTSSVATSLEGATVMPSPPPIATETSIVEEGTAAKAVTVETSDIRKISTEAELKQFLDFRKPLPALLSALEPQLRHAPIEAHNLKFFMEGGEVRVAHVQDPSMSIRLNEAMLDKLSRYIPLTKPEIKVDVAEFKNLLNMQTSENIYNLNEQFKPSKLDVILERGDEHYYKVRGSNNLDLFIKQEVIAGTNLRPVYGINGHADGFIDESNTFYHASQRPEIQVKIIEPFYDAVYDGKAQDTIVKNYQPYADLGKPLKTITTTEGYILNAYSMNGKEDNIVYIPDQSSLSELKGIYNKSGELIGNIFGDNGRIKLSGRPLAYHYAPLEVKI